MLNTNLMDYRYWRWGIGILLWCVALTIFSLGICGTLELSTIEQAVCVINSVFNEGVEIDDTHLIDQVDFGGELSLHAQS